MAIAELESVIQAGKERLLSIIQEQPQVVIDLVDRRKQQENDGENVQRMQVPYQLVLHKEALLVTEGRRKGAFETILDYDTDLPPELPKDVIESICQDARLGFERGETPLYMPCREYELVEPSNPNSSVRFVYMNGELPADLGKTQLEAAAQLPIIAHKRTH